MDLQLFFNTETNLVEIQTKYYVVVTFLVLVFDPSNVRKSDIT